MKKEISKAQLEAILKGIDQNFQMMRSTDRGSYYVSIMTLLEYIWKNLNNDEISIEESIQRAIAEYQIDELKMKYEIDEWLISVINSQPQIFDIDKDFQQLNDYAKDLAIKDNVIEKLKMEIEEAERLGVEHHKKWKERKKEESSLGYIYLIESSYGYKIGKTKNLQQRNKIFSVKMPFDYEIIYYQKCKDYHLLETRLHKRFDKKLINGEWFDLNPNDIEEIKGTLTAANKC